MLSFAAVFAANVLSTRPTKKSGKAAGDGADAKAAAAKDRRLAANRPQRQDETDRSSDKDH